MTICFLFGSSRLFAAGQRTQTTSYKNYRQQGIIVGLVDLDAVIAFHPAMRNFDYHAKKFVKPFNGKRYLNGEQAWQRSAKLRLKIKELETKINLQITKVNKILSEIQIKKANKTQQKQEIKKLKKLNKLHKKLLATLAKRTLDVFPDNDLTDINPTLARQIMYDINRAVYDIAKQYGIAFVFNTSQLSLSGNFQINSSFVDLQENSTDILDKFNIETLNDLKSLLFKTGKINSTPIGKKAAKMDFTKGPSGEHFYQIKDINHIKTLYNEYYENKYIFAQTLAKYGANRILLQGTTMVSEKNITIDVIKYIFALYKIKPKFRDTALQVLRSKIKIK